MKAYSRQLTTHRQRLEGSFSGYAPNFKYPEGSGTLFLQLQSVLSRPMLSQELASELQQTGVEPLQLSSVAFAEENSLWHKERHFYDFEGYELKAQRYSYLKNGKLLGLQTRRFISQWHGHLFYFSEEDPCQDYLGYCDLNNVYVQWLSLNNGMFALVLSNCQDSTAFYFESPRFWQDQEEEIVKYTVQLNFQEKYSVVSTLGKGSFSEVHKVKANRTGETLAAKIINKSDKKAMCTRDMAASQRRILHLMREQKGVSQFREFFETQSSYVIVLEYLPGDTLMTIFDQKRQLQVETLKDIFRNILQTLKKCHSRNIIHRDIKPHNIILSPRDLEPKIIDFGLALITNKEMEPYNYYKCGTMGFTAPEVLQPDSLFYRSYGYKCDIFSFGVMAHMLLMGSNPLAGISETERKKHSHVELNQEEIVQKYGLACLKFLQKLMHANPKLRYTADQALRSKFLSEDDSEELCYLPQSRRKGSYYLTASV